MESMVYKRQKGVNALVPEKAFSKRMIKRKKREQQEILTELKEAESKMNRAFEQFEFATEEELIDSYIYEYKAAQRKYAYLLRQLRETNQK